MATYKWSELAAGVDIAFDPTVDVLVIDDLSISAKGLATTGFSSGTSVTFTANGKALSLQTNIKALTTTNVTFADGSLFLAGDNSFGMMADDRPNTLIGGTGDDQLFGFSGSDTLDGGAGADVAAYGGPLADYRFSLSGGHMVIADTNAGNGDDGADLLISIEDARFSDGTIATTATGTGGEFRVNSYTTASQINPAITALSSGGFVVTWQSELQDGSGYGVYAQGYDAAGVAQGAEFRVNTHTAGDQSNPSITALSDGGFVVTWGSWAQDGSGVGVYAQRYNAAGLAQGAEFRVNTFIDFHEVYPAIAVLSSGGIVVTWQSELQDGSGYGVYAQRYDAAGVAQGAEFGINNRTFRAQTNPAIAALSNGGFVVTWQSEGFTSDDVYARRYDAAGVAQGSEFRLHAFTQFGHNTNPAIAALPSGDFVVIWEHFGESANESGVNVQRYNAAGVAEGAKFRVNTNPWNDEGNSAITALSDGGFVVTWQSRYLSQQDGNGYGVYARRYDASGVAQGVEFRVNTFIANDQAFPAITALSDGGFLVAWQSNGQDGDNYGVYAQRYDAAGNAVAATLSGDASANTLTWTGSHPVKLVGSAGDDTLTGGDGDDILAGDSGDNTINGGAGTDTAVYSGLASAYILIRDGWTTTVVGPDGIDTLVSVELLQFNGGSRTLEHADRDYGDNGKSDILWRNTNGSVAVWQMDGFTQSNGAIVGIATADWIIADGSGDYDGNGKSDLLWHNDNGNVAIWQMDGITVSSGLTFSIAPAGWKIADGAGDYNGDGKSDILLHHESGYLAMWQMDGMVITSVSFFGSASADWKIADGAGDYNGDGKSDILWRNDIGNVAVWLMDGFYQTAGAIVSSATNDWKIVDGSGDYNGDGKSDILWHNDNGNVAIWQMDGMAINAASTFSSASIGWHIADGSADYNGDGKSDILLHHNNGNVGMWLMDGMVIATGATISNASLDWAIPT